LVYMSNAMQTPEEILEQAKRLAPDERRRVAEELLAELDQGEAGKAQVSGAGPYAAWLAAAGRVGSDHTDLSTDKYKHVAAVSMQGHDEV